MQEKDNAPAWLEIVEVAPGHVELRREGDGEDSQEPLLRMQFSREALLMMGPHLGDVARGMIAAGLQLVTELQRRSAEGGGEERTVLH